MADDDPDAIDFGEPARSPDELAWDSDDPVAARISSRLRWSRANVTACTATALS